MEKTGEVVPVNIYIDTRVSMIQHPFLRMSRAMTRAVASIGSSKEAKFVIVSAVDAFLKTLRDDMKVASHDVVSSITTLDEIIARYFKSSPIEIAVLKRLLESVLAEISWVELIKTDKDTIIRFNEKRKAVDRDFVCSVVALRSQVQLGAAKLAELRAAESAKKADAMAELRAGRKQMAAGHLKQAKVFTKAALRQQGQTNNLEAILLELSNTHDTIDLVSTMREGVRVLRASMAGHSVEDADDVMEDVSLLLHEVGDVANTLSADVAADAAAIDVEDDLDALEAEMALERQVAAGSMPVPQPQSHVEPTRTAEDLIDEIETFTI
nr:vacuolar protein sorting 60C [Carpediemonas membranifera]